MTAYFRRLLPLLAVMGLATAMGGPTAAQEREEALTPGAHFMSGKLYMDKKIFDKAEREFRAAVKGDPTSAEYHGWWATALAEMATARLDSTSAITDKKARRSAIRALSPLFKEAAAEFDTALSIDPIRQEDFSGVNREHYWVELYKQADGLFQEKEFEEALEIYQLLTVLSPREPEGFFRVAYTLDRLEQPKQSVILAGQAKEMARERIAALGDCSQFRSTKRKNDCKRKITTMQTIVSNVDKFTKSKNAALGNDSFESAQNEKDPATRRAYLDEALQFYQAALDQDPSLLEVRFSLGNTYFNYAKTFEEPPDTGQANVKYREAARIFMALANADSTDAETKKDSIYNAGLALYQADNWSAALPVLKQYIDLDNRDADSYRRVAKCLVELGKPIDAVAYAKVANALADKGEAIAVKEAVGTIQNLYSQSDAAGVLKELGEPEEVRLLKDESGPGVQTWFWWTRGEIRHFLEGKELGRVMFTPGKTAPAASK